MTQIRIQNSKEPILLPRGIVDVQVSPPLNRVLLGGAGLLAASHVRVHHPLGYVVPKVAGHALQI